MNEDDVPSNVDDDPEIGAPKAPLGDCDVKADLEGISPNDWCSRELMTGAICEDGECVEPPGFGLPTDPPNNRPNPADRAQ